jgi:hypothetical protein
MEIRAPWVWRQGSIFGYLVENRIGAPPRLVPGSETFHAVDWSDAVACEPYARLDLDGPPAHEGDTLCSDCLKVVRSMPLGRERT